MKRRRARGMTLLEVMLSAALLLLVVGLLLQALWPVMKRANRQDAHLARVEQAVLVREFMLRRLDNAILTASDSPEQLEYVVPEERIDPEGHPFHPLSAAEMATWLVTSRFRLYAEPPGPEHQDPLLVEQRVGGSERRILCGLGPQGKVEFEITPPLIRVTLSGVDRSARPAVPWKTDFSIVQRDL